MYLATRYAQHVFFIVSNIIPQLLHEKTCVMKFKIEPDSAIEMERLGMCYKCTTPPRRTNNTVKCQPNLA